MSYAEELLADEWLKHYEKEGKETEGLKLERRLNGTDGVDSW